MAEHMRSLIERNTRRPALCLIWPLEVTGASDIRHCEVNAPLRSKMTAATAWYDMDFQYFLVSQNKKKKKKKINIMAM